MEHVPRARRVSRLDRRISLMPGMQTQLSTSLTGQGARARGRRRLPQVTPRGRLELRFRMGRPVPDSSSATRGEVVNLFSDTQPGVRARNSTLPGQSVF